MAISTLYDYYTSLGQKLPSVQQRSQIYSQAGLGAGYTGTAQQNTSLLGYLQKTPSSSGNSGAPGTSGATVNGTLNVNPNSTITSDSGSSLGTTYDVSNAVTNNQQNVLQPLLDQITKYATELSQAQQPDQNLINVQQSGINLQGQLGQLQTQETGLQSNLQDLKNQVIEPSLTGQGAQLTSGVQRAQADINAGLTPQSAENLREQTLNQLQQQGLNQQIGINALQQQLAQGTQAQKIQAAQTLYDTSRNTLSDAISLYTATAPKNISTNYNPTTGQLTAIMQNPINGQVYTQNLGNIGSQEKLYRIGTDPNTGNPQYGFWNPSLNNGAGGYVPIQTIDSSTGNPVTSSSAPNAAATVNNVSGIKGSNGQFIVYSSPEQSFQATVGDIIAKQTGNTKTGLTSSSTLAQFLSTWVNGSPSAAVPGYAASVSADLGVPLNTPFSTIDPTQLATAVARHETGWDESTHQFIQNQSATKLPGTTGSSIINSSVPGYATQAVPGSGGLTQAAIDQAALQYATTGQMPSIGLGSTGIGGQRKAAIINRAGELGQGTNIATNKATLTANSTALNQQVQYLNSVQRALTNAENGFQQLIQYFQDKEVNVFSAPLANQLVNNLFKSNVDPGSLPAFKATLAEISNEYTQVFSRGGQVTDAVRNKSNDILNGNLSIAELNQVQQQLQTQGNIVIQGTQQQIQSIQGQLNSILGGSQSVSGAGAQLPNIQQDIQAAIKDTANIQNREQLIPLIAAEYGIDSSQAANYVYQYWPDNTPR